MARADVSLSKGPHAPLPAPRIWGLNISWSIVSEQEVRPFPCFRAKTNFYPGDLSHLSHMYERILARLKAKASARKRAGGGGVVWGSTCRSSCPAAILVSLQCNRGSARQSRFHTQSVFCSQYCRSTRIRTISCSCYTFPQQYIPEDQSLDLFPHP